jgi:uncharacterized protein YfaS (alpha-2-macroglobulin family)
MTARSLLLLCGFLWILSACENKSAPAPTETREPSSTQATNSVKPNNLEIAVLDISERSRDGKNGVAVTLSTPVDPAQDIQDYFVIQQQSRGKAPGAWTLGPDGKQVWFMNIEPQQEYQVAVNPGLKALNNSVLAEAKSAVINTRPLPPSINFDSKGAVLPLGYSSGLPVVTVNIDAVDVDFFRIKDTQITQFLNFSRTYGRYGWYANNMKNHGELVYSGRFDLKPELNTRTKRDLPIHTLDALKKAGLYLVVMRAAGDYDQKQVTWFSVSDIGVHIRQYQNRLDVHTSSLSTGKPLGKVPVQLINDKGEVLLENTTTGEGTASFTSQLDQARVLVARTHDQLTLVDLRQPALDLSEFDLGKRPQLPVELFLYGPRDLYRPGENLIVSGLLRDFDGRSTQAPVLSASLRGPNGTVAREFKWQPRDAGYYQLDWIIPSDAPTGKWQLSVEGSLKHPVIYSFNVEEFLPERLKLTLAEGVKRSVLSSPNDSIELSVLGEYLYGAPAAGNRLSGFYQVSHWRSPLENLKDFQFGHLLDTSFSPHQDLDDITLDAEGKARLKIASGWQQSQSPLKVQITTSLYESGGRPVTRSHPVLIWPAPDLIGVRPTFGKENPEANSLAEFEVVKANLQGELLAAEQLEITLISEDRQYFWEYSDHEGWHWSWSDKEFPVASESLSFAAGEKGAVRFPVDWGNYRLEVKDPATGLITSVRFFAGYDWYHDWQNAESGGAPRPDRVNLALDKPRYKNGETAQLKILPPAAGEALVLVEGDAPLWSRKISVPAEGTTLEIPIGADWRSHNLYVTALMVEPSGKSKQITPKRSLGLIHLPLDRESRRLTVSFDLPEKVRPATTLPARLQLASAGKPEAVFVTLAAVDVGVLNITDFKTPDPFEHFFGPRRYGAEIRDMYHQVIEAHRADAAKLRFGGDAELARGGQKPQTEVQIVSLFRGPVAVDAEGRAEIPLALPDFNGRLRLMAVAFGEESFGSAEADVTVAAPVVVEIAMPRFLAYGDRSSIALDVQNMTDTEQTLKVSLTASGSVAMAAQSLELKLQPLQKHTLLSPIEAVDFSGTGLFTAKLESDTLDTLVREWKLGVRPAYPAITLQQQKVLRQGESLTLGDSDLPGTIAATRQATVELAPTVNLQVAAQLRELLDYPYGCLEQTTSRAHPLLQATPANQARFQLNPISEAERLKRIQAGVDRIAQFQKSNGAFGLWDKHSPEDQWLTVYATDFLLDAQALGLDVPASLLDQALTRLGYYLSSSGAFVGQRWSDDASHYAFASRAYAGYVLSRVKKAPLGALRTLYQRDFAHAKSGLSQVHLGLALLAMGDQKSGAEALAKAVQNIPAKDFYLGDYGSRIRDLGQMVALLLRHGQMQDQALDLSLKLRDALRGRQWFSTQERTALFFSGIALEQGLSQEWRAQWQLGSNPPQAAVEKSTWRKALDAADLSAGFTLTSDHPQALYADVLLNGYGEKPPQPQELGLSVARNWYSTSGKPVTPSKVKVGELLLVHLSLSAKQQVPDALLINLLPAGFELENQNLEHAIKLDRFLIDGKPLSQLQSQTQMKHQEYRDDRYVAAVEVSPWNSAHVFFLVRAVSPGVYQVPPPLAEDMYRPEIRGIGQTLPQVDVVEP